MDTTTTTDADANNVPRFVLHVTRPRCPTCGCVRLLRYGGIRVDDETVVRYVRCAECDHRGLMYLE